MTRRRVSALGSPSDRSSQVLKNAMLTLDHKAMSSHPSAPQRVAKVTIVRTLISGWPTREACRGSGTSAKARAKGVMVAALPQARSFSKPYAIEPLQIGLFVCARPDPSVPWNNTAAERDMRPVGRYRAITGGTRSARGSVVFGHWMSVVHTRRKNKLHLPVFIHAVNEAHLYGRAPPSVFIQ